MDPLTLALIMGAAGGAKYFTVDKPAADRQRHLAAETQRYSPWTHLQAQQVSDPSLLGDMTSWGLTGASMGQSMAAADSQNKLSDSMTKYYNQGGANSAANKTAAPQDPISVVPALKGSENPFVNAQAGAPRNRPFYNPETGLWEF